MTHAKNTDQRQEPAGLTAPPARILVVEDEPAVADVVVQMLTAQGHEASAAPGATLAITLLPHLKPDLVITDIVMPDGEGMELIRYLKHAQNPPAVIAMSGNPTGVLFLRASRVLGVQAALRKPFTPDELAQAIQTALATTP